MEEKEIFQKISKRNQYIKSELKLMKIKLQHLKNVKMDEKKIQNCNHSIEQNWKLSRKQKFIYPFHLTDHEYVYTKWITSMILSVMSLSREQKGPYTKNYWINVNYSKPLTLSTILSSLGLEYIYREIMTPFSYWHRYVYHVYSHHIYSGESYSYMMIELCEPFGEFHTDNGFPVLTIF